MAAAEARSVWQRTANRCLVQEDAKRAPKLASCPSACTQSNSNATSGHDLIAPNFMPSKWNPMTSNLPPDTKWWLQLQPSFGYQKDFTCEELNAFNDEPEEKNVETTVPTSEQLGERLTGGPMGIDSEKTDFPFETPWRILTTCTKHDYKRRGEEMKTVTSNSQQPPKCKMGTGDCFYGDEELMDWQSVEGLFSKEPEKACLDPETAWAGGNKCDPWWRFADKDELASLVAHKSQQHIENCDLPRPTQISKDPFACLECLDSSKIFSSSVGRKLYNGIGNPVDHALRAASGSIDGKHWSSSELGHSLCDTEKLSSDTPPESRPTSESDPSRAQLLEALRRSQTRAREAEMAAQKAQTENEHIVKLLFRQASHLFAYKQWLQMLQLESMCLQLRIKDHRLRVLFPVLPWIPLKGKPKKRRKCNGYTYAVVFAVGLGLAGAGLLLGWRLNWLAPTF